MEGDRDFPTSTVLMALFTTFAIAFLVTTIYFKLVRAGEHPQVDPSLKRLVAAIRTHPDPLVGDDFLGVDGRPGIQAEIKEIEFADGKFSVVDGRPRLTIGRSVMDASVSAEGIQKLWGVLSHEHEHYRQWLEGETKAYMTPERRFSETRCIQAVTLEIGAYAAGCRDARKFGWDGVRYQCEEISIETNAKEKIDHSLAHAPECESIWRLLADEKTSKLIQAETPPNRAAASSQVKPRRARLPQAHGATYLAPP